VNNERLHQKERVAFVITQVECFRRL